MGAQDMVRQVAERTGTGLDGLVTVAEGDTQYLPHAREMCCSESKRSRLRGNPYV